MNYPEPHPLAGDHSKDPTARLVKGFHDPRNMMHEGDKIWVEDWVHRLGLTTESVWTEKNNWAIKHYQARAHYNKVPIDEDVVYIKHNGLGHCVHTTELEGLR